MSSLFKNRVVEVAVGAGAVIAVTVCAMRLFTKRKKKITRIIDTMEVFKKSSVHMKDPDRVEELVSTLIKGGSARLQVISDFDSTLTRSHINGVSCPSSYCALECSSVFTEEKKAESTKMLEHYHAIEIDPHMSIIEKIPYMQEWYEKSHSLIVSTGLTKSHISEMVSLCGLALRDGCEDLFYKLYSNDVPLLIFSAGVGDILKEVLKQHDLLYPNVKIIANFMQFNEEEKLIGFKDELIHTFSKSASALQNNDYFDRLRARHNIILLGDTLGDLDMANGVKDTNCILKIGFLNRKIQENLPLYLKSYDIVLTDDQTMEIPNEILRHVL